MSVFDAHLHIIDPDYPLIENQGYLPEPFQVSDYLQRVKPLGVNAGAVVSGSFQGFDQSYLLAALAALGDCYVGVTQLPMSVQDDELHRLHEGGVRALRFNVRRGGSESLDELEGFAHRVYEMFGWHVELYAGYESLVQLEKRIKALPKVSIDHLGLNGEGLPLLKGLVESGCYVKATGFGRVDFDPFQAVRELYDVNPGALVFGTDLPSTRAPSPFVESHFYQLNDVLDESEMERACWKNALDLYNLSVSSG